MTSSGPTGSSAFNPPLSVDDRVEAIRYAVLRKLAPGLRHALMGEMQAIHLTAEYAARALDAGADPADLRKSIDSIPQQCSDAVKTGRSLIEWIDPGAGAIASVRECVDRCLKLAGEDWFLRGIEATTDLPDANVRLPKTSVQELIVTALLVLTDMHDQPGNLHLVARATATHVEFVLDWRAADRIASIPHMRRYRKLACADLELLASAHGVPCVCRGSGVSLQFSREAPT